MNQWLFVIAAYALVVVATGGLTLWAWRAMRTAERFADEVTRR